MSIYKCPKGHESTESDYCSECGAKIQGVPELAIAKNSLTSTVRQTAQAVQTCPDCTAPHDPESGYFCEICGYNFVTGGHGELPLASPGAPMQGSADVGAGLTQNSSISQITSINPPSWEQGSKEDSQLSTPNNPPLVRGGGNGEISTPPNPPLVRGGGNGELSTPNNPPLARGGGNGELSTPNNPPLARGGANPQSPIAKETAVAFEVVATIDPSLHEEGSPPPPTNQAPITFRLDKESNLIGRTSDRRGIHPEISLDFDDAVSHRHALLLCQPDGTFILRDIGSTNGTRLNGVELTAMVDTPIKEGDEFTLGHWTRIAVKRRVKGEG